MKYLLQQDVKKHNFSIRTKMKRPLPSLGSRRVISEEETFPLLAGGVIGMDDLLPTLWSGMSGYHHLREKKKESHLLA